MTLGPTDFESRVLTALGRIEEHMSTTKETLGNHSERLDTLERERDVESGKKSAFGWIKTPLQMASGGALTVFVQKFFGHQ